MSNDTITDRYTIVEHAHTSTITITTDIVQQRSTLLTTDRKIENPIQTTIKYNKPTQLDIKLTYRQPISVVTNKQHVHPIPTVTYNQITVQVTTIT